MALCRRSLFFRSAYRKPLRFACQRRKNSSGRDKFFRISEEVQDALATGKPVVALETTIYTHGFPYPENVALSSHLESLVRVNGGVPATIGILEGKACVGIAAEELIQLVSTAGSENTWKISRRDLGFIGGLGLRGQKLNGGTTIAGTMVLAYLAGIKVFATGGLGGVHRGGENSMDISADLTELGRTPVAVISSGCKSFLDIPRTLEYLETQGVGVGTFADGRQGDVDFPAFFSRDSGVKSPKTIQDEADAAAIIYAQYGFPVHSGLLFANPVPENSAMAKEEIDSIITQAVAEAEQKGIGGSANTPYILKRIRELSNGGSVRANEALIEANVVRGTKVAVELAKLERRRGAAPQRKVIRGGNLATPTMSTQSAPNSLAEPVHRSVEQSFQPVEILVAGSLASDTVCDHRPFKITPDSTTPTLHTSNPSTISQSPGGVGRNVAMAAHLAGARVTLASVVADDPAGASLLDHVENSGLGTTAIRRLSTNDGARTAQYVAVNDTNKDLMVAMADMSIFALPELESPDYWMAKMDESKPKWVVVDANWSPPILSSILKAAKAHQAFVAFEPVSVAKAARLFHKDNSAIINANVAPNHVVSLASPNRLELTAIYNSARNALMFESEQWWNTIDSLGLSGTSSRDRLISVAGHELVEHGIPQQCIQLLPFIPNLVTKLGHRGCLLACLLRRGDPRLTQPENAPYVLSRNLSHEPEIGGLYMRLIPPFVEVEQNEIVSVNGIGDTMLGVIVAGLAKGRTLEEVLPIAQQAAVLSLKSAEAVSPHVRNVQARLR
ncbi:serine/threonine protein kinase [Cladophialophora psammophila CBS 110553]|uniref:Serine/threonine protein kinase n=1 Tax=Cladophialophora psammophila CBS 110553 TaxID=1182543 RepID=W9XQE6_9EURO|nr:serine/threonine protein kinase [Cladophialophora psammophila CBS 110553]EXJ72554.1 serine/threonine protein kinase [Cladophialophora psammophila CBS 110553]